MNSLEDRNVLELVKVLVLCVLVVGVLVRNDCAAGIVIAQTWNAAASILWNGIWQSRSWDYDYLKLLFHKIRTPSIPYTGIPYDG